MTTQSFAGRLGKLRDLSTGDIATIKAMPWSVTRVNRGRDIFSLGQRHKYLYVIESGWAARYNVRSDGSRRITGFMLPGDFCGIHAMADEAMDHAILALSSCEVAFIEKHVIEEAVDSSPAICNALWRAKLTDEATLRTWLLYSNDSAQALAHLLCELHARADAVGLVEAGRFHAPLTQEQIGDALSITSVHTNRMIKLLRTQGMAEVANGEVVILNIMALQRFCSFSPGYLHLPTTGLRQKPTIEA